MSSDEWRRVAQSGLSPQLRGRATSNSLVLNLGVGDIHPHSPPIEDEDQVSSEGTTPVPSPRLVVHDGPWCLRTEADDVRPNEEYDHPIVSGVVTPDDRGDDDWVDMETRELQRMVERCGLDDPTTKTLLDILYERKIYKDAFKVLNSEVHNRQSKVDTTTSQQTEVADLPDSPDDCNATCRRDKSVLIAEIDMTRRELSMARRELNDQSDAIHALHDRIRRGDAEREIICVAYDSQVVHLQEDLQRATEQIIRLNIQMRSIESTVTSWAQMWSNIGLGRYLNSNVVSSNFVVWFFD